MLAVPRRSLKRREQGQHLPKFRRQAALKTLWREAAGGGASCRSCRFCRATRFYWSSFVLIQAPVQFRTRRSCKRSKGCTKNLNQTWQYHNPETLNTPQSPYHPKSLKQQQPPLHPHSSEPQSPEPAPRRPSRSEPPEPEPAPPEPESPASRRSSRPQSSDPDGLTLSEGDWPGRENLVLVDEKGEPASS